MDNIRNFSFNNGKKMESSLVFIKCKNTSKKKETALPGLNFKIVVIGSSTGGPNALKIILKELPHHFPLPIVVVQHITKNFEHFLAQSLNKAIPLSVKVAKHREVLNPGYVYIAPIGKHIILKTEQKKLTAHLTSKPLSSLHCPSIDVLFSSTAAVCGKESCGILLTGMGEDGALGLKEIYESGGITIAQKEETCLISSMPSHAIKLGATRMILSLDEISKFLIGLVRKER